MPDPLVGLAVAIAASALLGLATSVLILRGTDLTRLMVTLGVASILYELANKLDWLTGGADGLQGVVMGPLTVPFTTLKGFDFDLSGRTAYAYTLVVLAIVLLRLRAGSSIRRSASSLQALRDNRLRAASIGLSVPLRLVAVYTYRRRDRRRRRRAARADDRLRLARRVRLPPQRRGAARARRSAAPAISTAASSARSSSSCCTT